VRFPVKIVLPQIFLGFIIKEAEDGEKSQSPPVSAGTLTGG
jgi:hypothetical protein